MLTLLLNATYAPHLCSKLLLVAGSDVNLDYQDVISISYIQAFRSSTGTSTTEPPSTSQRAVESFMEVILKTTNELILDSLGKPQKEASLSIQSFTKYTQLKCILIQGEILPRSHP